MKKLEPHEYKYIDDLETMKSLDIESVMIATGLWELRENGIVHLEHEKIKKPKMKIRKDDNTCHCHDCHFNGGVLAVATHYKNGKFYDAVKWLAEEFSVKKIPNPEYQPPKEEENKWNRQKANYKKVDPSVPTKEIKETKYVLEYEVFDNTKSSIADLKNGEAMYAKLPYVSRMMLIYTEMYRFSLMQDRKELIEYFANRKINTSHTRLEQLGFIPVSNFKGMINFLYSKFEEDITEDLVELGVILPSTHNDAYNFTLRYVLKGGLIVFPSFDLYKKNLITGFMLRPTQPEQWMIDKHMKEIQMSNQDLKKTLPHGCTFDLINDSNAIKCIVEGGPDAYCCDEEINGKKLLFMSSPGTNGFKAEQLGLFKGQILRIMFDQDSAGRCGANGYITLGYSTEDGKNKKENFPRDKKGLKALALEKKRLELNKISFSEYKYDGLVQKCFKAGVQPQVVSWDEQYGGDLNDVRKNMLCGKTPFKSMNEFLTKYTTVTRINNIN